MIYLGYCGEMSNWGLDNSFIVLFKDLVVNTTSASQVPAKDDKLALLHDDPWVKHLDV